MNDPKKMLRQKIVRIRREHLNPWIRSQVGGVNIHRLGRLALEGFTAGNLYYLFNAPNAGTVAGAGISYIGSRMETNNVKEWYGHVMKMMNEKGILQTRFEGYYPKDWINPSIVKSTHPIFAINPRGDILFFKPTRAEYYRYIFQNSTLGKRYHPWWYRGYLATPTVPEPMKKWARDKLRKTIEKVKEELKPRRSPKPAMVPIRVRARKRRTR